ncbi:CBS domain-containing protein [Alteromonas halophila]|uniref:CBS domain-containing protein n=1 Tax=Alteromonas halophila TaxID=516698 RepID=A0A918JCX3_9ALTE|nr:CBS domain-containing protein [Alteromonas halophila]GGW74982.1 CBS domain-containing protein [Alteromonas halophila]
MAVSNIMTTRVVTVHLDDSLATIQALFEETGFHHLVVVDGQRVEGVISDRDLLKALSPFIDTISERARDRATLERKAHQIMTREVITLEPADTIVSAVALFNRHGISCIPVVDPRRQLQGILSWRDIMRYVETLVSRKKQA